MFILKKLVMENFDYKFQIFVGKLVAVGRLEWFLYDLGCFGWLRMGVVLAGFGWMRLAVVGIR